MLGLLATCAVGGALALWPDQTPPEPPSPPGTAVGSPDRPRLPELPDVDPPDQYSEPVEPQPAPAPELEPIEPDTYSAPADPAPEADVEAPPDPDIDRMLDNQLDDITQDNAERGIDNTQGWSP